MLNNQYLLRALSARGKIEEIAREVLSPRNPSTEDADVTQLIEG